MDGLVVGKARTALSNLVAVRIACERPLRILSNTRHVGYRYRVVTYPRSGYSCQGVLRAGSYLSCFLENAFSYRILLDSGRARCQCGIWGRSATALLDIVEPFPDYGHLTLTGFYTYPCSDPVAVSLVFSGRPFTIHHDDFNLGKLNEDTE